MSASNVSASSMGKEGLRLVTDLYELIKKMQAMQTHVREKDSPTGRYKAEPAMPKSEDVINLMVLAVHRLQFLEMVVKGMRFMELHDAQAYAKFVESKRKIEDMDIEELRVLLR